MAKVHPSAIVDKDIQLDDDVVIGPYCCIGPRVRIESGTVLGPHVVVEHDVTIGKNNTFYAHCVIGGLPQVLGWGLDAEAGSLKIGDGNMFREQVTVHRSMHPDKVTIIGNENLFMVGVHIGHDCLVEDRVVLTNLVQVGGHCKMETGGWISGLVGLHQFVTFGQWAYVAGLSCVTRDVSPFVMISGSYPTRVRGVNIRGLRRAGFDMKTQKSIMAAFHKLYRTEGTLLENALALAEEGPLSAPVQVMVESIQRSSQHRFGRYRELSRA
jgi:UDP-N-acetylglucosamine acyltransferase